MQAGWSRDETSGDRSYVWSEGERSVLRVLLPSRSDVRMDFEVNPFTFPNNPPQRVSILLNETMIGEVSLSPGLQKYSVTLPANVLLESPNTLEFRYAYARAPRDVVPNSADTRKLAVAWYSIDFAAQSP